MSCGQRARKDERNKRYKLRKATVRCKVCWNDADMVLLGESRIWLLLLLVCVSLVINVIRHISS
jgi:hypothetical protein